jgi:hypothetical protein
VGWRRLGFRRGRPSPERDERATQFPFIKCIHTWNAPLFINYIPAAPYLLLQPGLLSMWLAFRGQCAPTRQAVKPVRPRRRRDPAKTNHETAARSRGAGHEIGKAVRGRNRGSPAQEKGATQPNPTDRPNGRKAIKASRGALSSSLLPNNKREENASSSRPRSAATRVPPNLQQAAGAAGPFILPPLRPSSPALPLRAAAAISCGTAPRFSIWGIIVYSLRGIFSGVCVILSVTAAWGLRVLIGGCGVDCS